MHIIIMKSCRQHRAIWLYQLISTIVSEGEGGREGVPGEEFMVGEGGGGEGDSKG